MQDFPIDQLGNPPVLMGGFNHGPKHFGEVSPEYPASHQSLLDAGYISPYSNALNPCTWCVDNPLTGKMTGSVIADHIYLKHGQEVSGVQVKLDIKE